MQKRWFAAKRHGWGWTPSSWEGWVVTLVYGLVLAWSVGRFTNYVVGHTGEPLLDILYPVLTHALWVSVLIGSLMYICVKTSEGPRPSD